MEMAYRGRNSRQGKNKDDRSKTLLGVLRRPFLPSDVNFYSRNRGRRAVIKAATIPEPCNDPRFPETQYGPITQ